MKRSPHVELRVGIFVLVAIIIGGTIAFYIGERRQLFGHKETYYAIFKDVSGLRGGSPVLVGGVTVGSVDDMEFEGDGRIRVALLIREDAQPLIREGSVATLTNKGMMGDKQLSIDAGEGPVMPPESVIPSDDTASLSSYLDKAGRVLSDAESIAHNIRVATDPLGRPEFGEDVRATAENLAELTEMATEGNGTVHRLMTDEEMSKRLSSSVRNLEEATAQLSDTAKSMRAVVDEIRTGDGSAHELIYGQDGTRLVRNFADAAQEVSTLLRHVREGEGTMHGLVYGEEGKDLLANLTQVSEDLRVITGDLREGRGTLGGLLQDPSIYEDVKRLVGDLQRNDILRALVRYSIRRDERVESADVSAGQ